jgi:nucleoside phosphorylase
MERIEGSMPWFRSESAALVLSGVGKSAAAAATAYLHARTGEVPHAVWINAGVAGHRSRPIGDIALAHTVIDDASGRRWYPTRLGGPSLDSAEIRTVDARRTELATDALYDMEASGFYPVALRFSTIELVQSLKIVSDHGASPVRAERVRELVESRVDSLAETADHLEALASALGPLRRDERTLAERYHSRWRFTTTEDRRLRRLLGRWGTLEPAVERAPSSFEGAPSAAEVLRRLDERLRALSRERAL